LVLSLDRLADLVIFLFIYSHLRDKRECLHSLFHTHREGNECPNVLTGITGVSPSLFIFMAPIPGLNKDVLDRIVNELGLQSAFEKLPVDLVATIQPVLIANPKRNVNTIRGTNKATTGTTTLFTTPADRDFFLTSASLNNQSDVSADNTGISLSVIPEGKAADEILRFDKITLTVFQDSIALVFNPPIKLERGSAISFGSTFAAGASITGATITGYDVDIL